MLCPVYVTPSPPASHKKRGNNGSPSPRARKSLSGAAYRAKDSTAEAAAARTESRPTRALPAGCGGRPLRAGVSVATGARGRRAACPCCCCLGLCPNSRGSCLILKVGECVSVETKARCLSDSHWQCAYQRAKNQPLVDKAHCRCSLRGWRAKPDCPRAPLLPTIGCSRICNVLGVCRGKGTVILMNTSKPHEL